MGVSPVVEKGEEMTKADIAEIISEKNDCSRKDAVDYVETCLEIIKDTLTNGENVKLSGFGQFCVKSKSARRGRNPQTGKAITIEPRRVVTFNLSHVLRAEFKKQG